MSAHTPGPWRWVGEDYRGDWGWQLLVGPSGEGLIVGDGGDGNISPFLRVGMPVDPALCVTGLVAEGKPHVAAVHVFSPANAHLIVAAPDLLAACKAMLTCCGSSRRRNGETDDALKLIEAAVARAEGRP